MKIDAKVLPKIKCHWSIHECINWRPIVRAGATLTVCGNKVVLFGGYNKLAMNDIHYLDLKRGIWQNISVSKGKRPTERYGHSAVYHKGNIIIFGGEYKYNTEIRMRETMCDLWAYNVANNEFQVISQGQKLICEPRKDHAMAQVGINLIIHGGINSRGIMLDDLVSFNFCMITSIFKIVYSDERMATSVSKRTSS